MSKTLITIIVSSVVALGVSATFLFPVIKDLNSAVSEEESNRGLDKTSKVSTTVSAVDNSSNSIGSKENPSIQISESGAENNVAGTYQKSDTINSEFLIDDVPMHRK